MALAEQGRLDEAEQLLGSAGMLGPIPPSILLTAALGSRGRLRLAQGDAAARDRGSRRRAGSQRGAVPASASSRRGSRCWPRRSCSPTAATRPPGGRGLRGARGRLGHAPGARTRRRMRALVAPRERAIALLEEARAHFAASHARLELARCLTELGARRRAAGERRAARAGARVGAGSVVAAGSVVRGEFAPTASSAASQRECSSGGNHVECDASVATDRTRRRGLRHAHHGDLDAHIFHVKKKPPAANTNKIELTVGKGEPLRVSFVGHSMDYGLFATKPALGFHELMVGEWRKSGSVADVAGNTIGGTARDALKTPDFPRDQQLYIVELGTNNTVRVDSQRVSETIQ